MGNCGMIAGAFSSTSGKADITLTTNGQILYYNSGRQRLAIGNEGTVLTVSDADLPAWETAAAGASLSGNNTWTGTNDYQDDVLFTTFSSQTRAAKTIASAKITMSTNLATVDTEASASSDDLNEAEGLPSSTVFSLRAFNAARTVVVKDTTGSIQFLMSGDATLDNSQDTITFCKFDGTHNYELSRSDNAS